MEYLSYVCNPELPSKKKQLLQMLEDSFQALELHRVCYTVNRGMLVFSKG